AEVITEGDGAAALAPDGRAFAVGIHNETRRYQINGLDVQRLVAPHSDRLFSLAVSKSGRRLACSTQGALTVWPLGEPALAPSHQLPIGGFAPDDPPVLCFLRDGELAHYQPREKVLHTWPIGGAGPGCRVGDVPRCSGLSLAPDGRLWGAIDDQVRAWKMPSGTQSARWTNFLGLGEILTGRPQIYAVAAGDDWVVAAGRDGAVRIVPAGVGELPTPPCPAPPARPLASAPPPRDDPPAPR